MLTNKKISRKCYFESFKLFFIKTKNKKERKKGDEGEKNREREREIYKSLKSSSPFL